MKSTKKSLFITTIAMVVLMVVALSTATFAWYTASGTTKAENAVLKTATSSDANIAISWANTESQATSITFADNSGTVKLAPMAPTALITTATTPTSIKFSTQTLDNEGKFNGAGEDASPWRTTENDTAARQDFYVINNNLNAGTTVSMKLVFPTLTVEADIAEQTQMKNGLKIVVFVNDAAYAIFGAGGSYKYGAITKGAAGDSLTAADGTLENEVKVTALDGTVTFNLAASNTTDDKDVAKITAMAWFDGVWLTQEDAGKGLGFSFNFVGGTLVS